jgi:hypothetical protein
MSTKVNGQNGLPLDVYVQPAGKIFLFHLLTQGAKDWVNENVSDEAQFFGDALVVEDRYVGLIAHAMIHEGALSVQ